MFHLFKLFSFLIGSIFALVMFCGFAFINISFFEQYSHFLIGSQNIVSVGYLSLWGFLVLVSCATFIGLFYMNLYVFFNVNFLTINK
jgi:hypothetical protein